MDSKQNGKNQVYFVANWGIYSRKLYVLIANSPPKTSSSKHQPPSRPILPTHLLMCDADWVRIAVQAKEIQRWHLEQLEIERLEKAKQENQ